MTKGAKHKLVLIDGNSLLYRAFFALPPLTNAQGEMTNAAYGFTTMLVKVLREERPDLTAVAFDLPTPTFRHRQFPAYKATRDQMPDELAAQIEMVHEILEAMRIPRYALEGYEADDVIGTLAARAEQAGIQVLVVTGDLDELQLVSDRVSVMVTRRGITDAKVYDPVAVRERFGFPPEKLPDYRALRGDTSDNIPGVPGVGEKTASALIATYGSLEEVLAHVDEVRPARIGEALRAHADLARRARELSTIVRDLPLELDLEALQVREPDGERLAAIFRRLDFRTLLAQVAPAQTALRAGPPAEESHRVASLPAEARKLAAELEGVESVVLVALAEPGPAMRARLAGVCLAPLAEELAMGEPAVVMAGEGALPAVLAPLRGLLESARVKKTGHDLKRVAVVLGRHGIELRGLAFDTMIASYLTNPEGRHDLESSASDHLAGRQAELALGNWGSPEAAAATARRVAALRARLVGELRELGMEGLFRQVEMPLVEVLARMERTGVAVDVAALEALSSRLAERTRELEQEIWALAGEQFTIGSPKQLRAILFDKLGLPPDKSRRTKTGYSTDAEALASLSDHEIVAKILEYREVTKLRSTYVEALPRLIHPETGRVHTTLNQAVTATGRLSSSDPNLQNIPVRTPLGMEIRRAFVAGEREWVLLSCDYSQIELRILAHITGDENLIAVFREDEDLHRAAAMEIFGVGADAVTPEMRAFAKMVNFGIPYGISEFRLAREMGISVEEASRYVARYFARFPKVQEYIQRVPEEARRTGYVQTLFGRRRPLPELRTRVAARRAAAERMAINTPMQGTAADIIKVAMLRVEEGLASHGLRGRMILQVHDELLLEVPEAELEETAGLVVECMAGACELEVPLKVDAKAGPNWLQMRSLARA